LTPQIQINKQIVKTVCGSDELNPYPVRSFTYCNEQARTNEVQWVIVYNVDFRMTHWSSVTQTHTITDSLYS
jgi:hypothetical protein